MSQPEAVRETIDPSFVPRIKPTVASVELDGERVVYDMDSWRLHKLDPVASLVWSCFDGSADIAELSADLADAFGTEVGQVTADVVELVRTLADQDLLVRVADDNGGIGGFVPDDGAGGGPADGTDTPSYLVDPPGG